MKIKFLKNYVNKKKGKVHDFEISLAKKLIKEKIAEEYKTVKKSNDKSNNK